jgi:hypothetical protein
MGFDQGHLHLEVPTCLGLESSPALHCGKVGGEHSSKELFGTSTYQPATWLPQCMWLHEHLFTVKQGRSRRGHH